MTNSPPKSNSPDHVVTDLKDLGLSLPSELLDAMQSGQIPEMSDFSHLVTQEQFNPDPLMSLLYDSNSNINTASSTQSTQKTPKYTETTQEKQIINQIVQLVEDIQDVYFQSGGFKNAKSLLLKSLELTLSLSQECIENNIPIINDLGKTGWMVLSKSLLLDKQQCLASKTAVQWKESKKQFKQDIQDTLAILFQFPNSDPMNIAQCAFLCNDGLAFASFLESFIKKSKSDHFTNTRFYQSLSIAALCLDKKVWATLCQKLVQFTTSQIVEIVEFSDDTSLAIRLYNIYFRCAKTIAQIKSGDTSSVESIFGLLDKLTPPSLPSPSNDAQQDDFLSNVVRIYTSEFETVKSYVLLVLAICCFQYNQAVLLAKCIQLSKTMSCCNANHPDSWNCLYYFALNETAGETPQTTGVVSLSKTAKDVLLPSIADAPQSVKTCFISGTPLLEKIILDLDWFSTE